MIPRASIIEWRAKRAPWPEDGMVEQDLVLSRAIVNLFSDPELAASLRFRGGTCLYKLFLDHPVRYSEDLDLVQTRAEPVGKTLTLIRERLSWLGKPKSSAGPHSVALVFSFETELAPVVKRKVKVEINTREQFALFDPVAVPFQVDDSWFRGAAPVPTFSLDELLGTKLRALYQRRKGRDLFDLWYLGQRLAPDHARVVQAFQAYVTREGLAISREAFADNLTRKLADPRFAGDVRALLHAGIRFDQADARRHFDENYLSRL